MKKIWKLYIIFFIFFVFGDLLSTFAILEVKEAVEKGEREAAVPEECVCKMPAHCDRSLTATYIKDNFKLKVTLLKIGVALLVLLLVFADMNILLLSLTIFMILVTGNNLGILFFPIRSIMPYFECIGVYYIIKWFAIWKD